MIIYVSSATDYSIYNREFNNNSLTGGQQAQKFNNLLIRGLSVYTPVTAVSNLPYKSGKRNSRPREEKQHENIRYVCIKNHTGKLTHKISNIISVIKEIKRAAKKERPVGLVCDAINLAASAACLYCAKRLNLPSVAIITDVPEIMCNGHMGVWMNLCAKLMKKHDAYVLLTKAMNHIVNPCEKPYIIMEGSCEVTDPSDNTPVKDKPPVCLFTGSLGSGGGLEQMIEGFIQSCSDIAELHIYGDGDFVPKLTKICDKHPSVKYFGLVQNQIITQIQKSATLLINPRLTTLKYCEYSFPSKLMEYMASGTPVLTTHLPGIPEEYDEHLIYIKDETAEGFAIKIRETLDMNSQERDSIGNSAKNYVLGRKSNSMQAQRILKMCNDIK